MLSSSSEMCVVLVYIPKMIMVYDDRYVYNLDAIIILIGSTTCILFHIYQNCLLHYFRYKVEISGGLGAQAGKIWRIGLMGYNATPDNVRLVLRALREGLMNTKSAKL